MKYLLLLALAACLHGEDAMNDRSPNQALVLPKLTDQQKADLTERSEKLRIALLNTAKEELARIDKGQTAELQKGTIESLKKRIQELGGQSGHYPIQVVCEKGSIGGMRWIDVVQVMSAKEMIIEGKGRGGKRMELILAGLSTDGHYDGERFKAPEDLLVVITGTQRVENVDGSVSTLLRAQAVDAN